MAFTVSSLKRRVCGTEPPSYLAGGSLNAGTIERTAGGSFPADTADPISDELTRTIAYALRKGRERPIGSPDEDWFAARNLVNAVDDARSEEPSEFFHCFTRSSSVDDAFTVLESMLKIGLLLTPEQLTFYPNPTTTQCRLSLAFIPRGDLFRHGKKFGPFALQMKPYETLVRYGASPVWYIPSFIKSDTGEEFSPHGHELVSAIARTQGWIHEMRNDCTRAPERHDPHRMTRLVLRLLYPTHYKDSTDLRSLYFLQREWRIIRRDSDLDQLSALNDEQRKFLLGQNEHFFAGTVKVWSEEEGAIVDRKRVEATFRLNIPFNEVVSAIIVPASEVERVERLKPGVPVISSERYEYGFYQ